MLEIPGMPTLTSRKKGRIKTKSRKVFKITRNFNGIKLERNREVNCQIWVSKQTKKFTKIASLPLKKGGLASLLEILIMHSPKHVCAESTTIQNNVLGVPLAAGSMHVDTNTLQSPLNPYSCKYPFCAKLLACTMYRYRICRFSNPKNS